MKITNVEVFLTDATWRNFLFVKLTTDDVNTAIIVITDRIRVLAGICGQYRRPLLCSSIEYADTIRAVTANVGAANHISGGRRLACSKKSNVVGQGCYGRHHGIPYAFAHK